MENFPSLAIDPALATLWPNTALGLMGLEASVFADTSSIWEEFERKTGPQLRKALSTTPLAQMPSIGEARSAFRAFGTDPGRYRVSSEALYRRLRQGKDIYRINSLVDTNNVLSLQCGHSCGNLSGPWQGQPAFAKHAPALGRCRPLRKPCERQQPHHGDPGHKKGPPCCLRVLRKRLSRTSP